MHPTEANSVFFCHFTIAEEGLIRVRRREEVRVPASSRYRTLQKEGSFMSERGRDSRSYFYFFEPKGQRSEAWLFASCIGMVMRSCSRMGGVKRMAFLAFCGAPFLAHARRMGEAKPLFSLFSTRTFCSASLQSPIFRQNRQKWRLIFAQRSDYV